MSGWFPEGWLKMKFPPLFFVVVVVVVETTTPPFPKMGFRGLEPALELAVVEPALLEDC